MKKLRILISSILLSLSMFVGHSQSNETMLQTVVQDFIANYRISENYRPKDNPKLIKLKVREKERMIDLYANEAFGAQPFTPQIISTLYQELKKELPSPYNTYAIRIYGNGKKIETLIPNTHRKDIITDRLWGKLDYQDAPWVKNISHPVQKRGVLANRHLSVWASHGRYYKHAKQQWVWQRPNLYCTNEDLFTQTFVTPYLIPMLEQAGAIVYTPRERFYQPIEIIVDNDSSQLHKGIYREENSLHEKWETPSPPGFAHKQAVYYEGDNPFLAGTARNISSSRKKERLARCIWMPVIPQNGSYPVYVSYQSSSGHIDDAHYTVVHKGIRTDFHVNQQMGGNTWVYLGTFEFDKGCSAENAVYLTNESKHQGIVSADAVRFGGGMGNIARGLSQADALPSGLPRFAEGARYAAQWNGLPNEVYSSKHGTNDYGDDINVRSYATNYIGGGSLYLPKSDGYNVPFELSLAVHSDAGTTEFQEQIYGSLGICTTFNSDLYTHYISGISRYASFDFASILLENVVRDLTPFTPNGWTRRELFDRNYSETRNPEIPSAIIETLSHQNFSDMRLGHDPNFKFALARALYKSVLKFTAFQHEKDYVVQPLPVTDFYVTFDGLESVLLSWSPQIDSLEPTAVPSGYIVYTKINDSDFDNGTYIKNKTTFRKPIIPGVQYSFKVTAVNEGGESFPSEILTAYKDFQSKHTILIVNGFNRLSGPAPVCTADSVGFDLYKDIGVPYIQTTGYCGFQSIFNPTAKGKEDYENAGYSGSELEGKCIAGNTFDYPYLHGTALRNFKGVSYVSCNKSVLEKGIIPLSPYKVIDLILGLEKEVSYNIKSYKTFSNSLQKSLTQYCMNGGNLLVSGSYIASDMKKPEERNFTANVLKYQYAGTARQDTTGHVSGLNLTIPITKQFNNKQYAAVDPDCILPVAPAFSAFLYGDGSPAGIAYHGKTYNAICLGFPFECISSKTLRVQVMHSIMQFLLTK